MKPFALPPGLVLALSLCASTALQAADNLPTLVKKIKPAVVTVNVVDSKGNKGLGSGFFIKVKGQSEALVLTNHHVIAGGITAFIKSSDGKVLVVDGVVASSKKADLALLKITGVSPKQSTLEIARKPPAVAEKIIAIGAPSGLEFTVSDGIVSSIRSINDVKWIQITAPISRGSSGGPILNLKGQVVGASTFFFRGGQNLNFASPYNEIAALKAHKKIALAVWSRKNPARAKPQIKDLNPGSGVEITGPMAHQFLKDVQATIARFERIRKTLSRATIRESMQLKPSEARVLNLKEKYAVPEGGVLIPKKSGDSFMLFFPSKESQFRAARFYALAIKEGRKYLIKFKRGIDPGDAVAENPLRAPVRIGTIGRFNYKQAKLLTKSKKHEAKLGIGKGAIYFKGIDVSKASVGDEIHVKGLYYVSGTKKHTDDEGKEIDIYIFNSVSRPMILQAYKDSLKKR